jgi:hypothetical protein
MRTTSHATRTTGHESRNTRHVHRNTLHGSRSTFHVPCTTLHRSRTPALCPATRVSPVLCPRFARGLPANLRFGADRSFLEPARPGTSGAMGSPSPPARGVARRRVARRRVASRRVASRRAASRGVAWRRVARRRAASRGVASRGVAWRGGKGYVARWPGSIPTPGRSVYVIAKVLPVYV